MTGSWYTHPELLMGSFGFGMPILGLLLVWSLAIKGYALWFAARNGQKTWFVFMLLVNLLGIPEIVYLVWFRNGRGEQIATAPAPAPAPSTVEATSKEV